jgi:hypothetical protein
MVEAITWSINEKTGVSAGMEMTRKYRIDNSFRVDNKGLHCQDISIKVLISFAWLDFT